MRINGKVSFEIADAEPVYNEVGDIIPAEVVWTEPVGCLVSVTSDNRLGRYEDGEFHAASFSILLEGFLLTSAQRLRLEMLGEPQGEFRIISQRPLMSFRRTQILV